jgi:Tol biopolymer transport system component
MPLTSGARLGPYEVVGSLGAGGMGEVYRGRDPRLGREVAIKVLPAAVSSDPERLHRFEQEARAAAALNHPNILAVFDIGQHDGSPYIVSELLEGETLRERLAAGGLPVRTAVEYGVQIAHGLAAAHEKGIVHRDLKPANVFVTTDGRVKILDFGLAKLVDPEPAAAGMSLLATGDTAPGVVLGTFGYMSPEQVRGATIDRRSDIFAFGVILYELLTGRRAFARETAPETMTAILREDVPDLHASAQHVTPQLEQVLRRCLDKDPSRRFQSTQDLAFALSTVGAPSSSSSGVAAITGAPRKNWPRLVFGGAAGFVVLIALVTMAAVLLQRRTTTAQPVRRLALTLPDAEPLAAASFAPLGLGKISIAISPDGKRVVYVANRSGTPQLVVRELDQFDVRPLRGTEGAYGPFFSPDGGSVGFFTQTALKRLSLAGGDPVTVAETRHARSGAWLSDDSIVFGNLEGSQLMQAQLAGSSVRTVVTSEYMFQSVGALPNAATVLVDIREGPNPDFNTIEAISIQDGKRKQILQGGTHPVYADGRLLFTRSGTLFAAPFDVERLEVTGQAIAAVEGVRSETEGTGQFAVAGDGTLVYVEGAPGWEGTPVWVSRDGKREPIGTPKRVYGKPVLSPDGRRLAFEVAAQTVDIWVFEIGRGTFTRLTQEGKNSSPVWSPDGRLIAYAATRGDTTTIVSRPADGSGPETTLWNGKPVCRPYSWAPDGKSLALGCSVEGREEDLYSLWPGAAMPLRPFVSTVYSDWGPSFSPDGGWIAYISDASGQYEIYVRPYPGPGSQWQISTGGGEEPTWSRDGKEIFYRNGTKWMVTAVNAKTEFSASPPMLLFQGPFVNVPGPSYDVGPDGRFVLLEGPPETPVRRLNVVLNWFDDLRRLVPPAR